MPFEIGIGITGAILWRVPKISLLFKTILQPDRFII